MCKTCVIDAHDKICTNPKADLESELKEDRQKNKGSKFMKIPEGNGGFNGIVIYK